MITVLLAAISTLAWPLLALAVLLRYSAQIGRLLDRFGQGKLTIKIGNAELGMEEVSKQQWQIVECMGGVRSCVNAFVGVHGRGQVLR